MSESLVYRNSVSYEFVMIALYGRHYAARYRAIADLIPAGSSVLDLCCGPGILYSRYLKTKAVAYTGLDLSPRFVARVCRHGGQGIVWDLFADRRLPCADSVVMQASLYHFLPHAAPVVRRMVRAAREQVIIAEPVRNLATSGVSLLAAFSARHTNVGRGDEPRRFTAQALDALFSSIPVRARRAFSIPGGRERIYVLEPEQADTASGTEEPLSAEWIGATENRGIECGDRHSVRLL